MRPLAGMNKFEFRSVLRLSKAGGELDLAELEEGPGDTSPAGTGGRSHCCPAYHLLFPSTAHFPPPPSGFISLSRYCVGSSSWSRWCESQRRLCLASPLGWELVSRGACLSAPQTEVVVDFGLKFKLNTLVLFSPSFLSLFSHFNLLI